MKHNGLFGMAIILAVALLASGCSITPAHKQLKAPAKL